MKSICGKRTGGGAATFLMGLLWGAAAGGAWAGNISGTYANLPPGTVINLTAEGAADWVHWGLYSETSCNRKRLVRPQISDYALLIGEDGYAQVFQYGDNTNGYSWCDGWPELSATNTTTGLWAFSYPVSEGTGFEISAPADARPRTLKVYVGVYSGQGEITASLSDNSAPPYVESSLSYNGNGESRVYGLTYAADSPGQTLRVTWRLKKKQGGTTQVPNVTLQAAALSTPGINVPPGVTLASPTNTAQFAAGQPIPLTAGAGDADGSVTNVAFFANGVKLGETASSPYALTWSNVPAGLHHLTAVATDDAGESTTSPPVEIVVYGAGGLLSGNLDSPPAAVDLSAEGTLDWIHWGLTGANSVDRNASVSPLMTNVARLGTNTLQQFTDSSTLWLWNNGDPTPNNPGCRSGVFVIGRANGFELAIPASTHPRKLRLYAGLYGAQIGFRACLADFSAPAYYTTLSRAYETVDGVFTVQFASASPGQMLLIRLESQTLFDALFGNLRLMSATLQVDDSVALPVLLTDPRRVGDDFRFAFPTLSNHLYTVEYRDDWAASDWTPLASLPGTDDTVVFTHSNAPPGACFYRVLAQ